MKKHIALALASLSIFSSAVLAVSPTLDNFELVNTYESGVYTDVSEGMWYTPGIINTYELGLLTGVAEGQFGANSNLTIAQSLAIACRLHSIYNGGTGEFTQGTTWYQVYVDYALNNGIITSRQFSDYNQTATRAQFAGILYSSLGSTGLKAINNITYIPDVTSTVTFSGAIYALYNAGVLTGNDSAGTFSPDSYITRAEVATIVSRMADESARKTFTLSTTPTTGQYVDIETTYVTLESGDSKKIDYTTNITNSTPLWRSNNPAICSVDQNGNITGLSKGTALISVIIGDYNDAFTVYVTGSTSGSNLDKEQYVSLEYYEKYTEYVKENGTTNYSFDQFVKDILSGKIEFDRHYN